jgi:predicted RNase H-like nuclease (RuvC/YqgF family)
MPRRKSLEDLSSEELYRIAREREEQERLQEEEDRREQISALREERKALVARHRSELAALDRQIRALGGRAAGARGRSGGTNLTRIVLDAVAQAGKISTSDLRSQLEGRGVNVKNLSQTLAYLKRTGRLKSRGRGIYAPA